MDEVLVRQTALRMAGLLHEPLDRIRSGMAAEADPVPGKSIHKIGENTVVFRCADAIVSVAECERLMGKDLPGKIRKLEDGFVWQYWNVNDPVISAALRRNFPFCRPQRIKCLPYRILSDETEVLPENGEFFPVLPCAVNPVIRVFTEDYHRPFGILCKTTLDALFRTDPGEATMLAVELPIPAESMPLDAGLAAEYAERTFLENGESVFFSAADAACCARYQAILQKLLAAGKSRHTGNLDWELRIPETDGPDLTQWAAFFRREFRKSGNPPPFAAKA